MNLPNLPIDIVPGYDPPVFAWNQVVDTPAGKQVVEHQESLPPTVEDAVATLIRDYKRLLRENAGLQGSVDALAKRAGTQVEPTRPTRKAK